MRRHLYLVELRTPLCNRPGFLGFAIAVGFALVALAGVVYALGAW